MVEANQSAAAALQAHLQDQPGLNVLIAAAHATLPVDQMRFADEYLQANPLPDCRDLTGWELSFQKLWTERLQAHAHALTTMINYTQFAAGTKVPSFRVEVSESRNPDYEFEIMIDIFGERACGVLWRNGQWSGHS